MPAAFRGARVEPARQRGHQRAEVQRPGGRGREPACVHDCLEYTAALFGKGFAVATIELTSENFEQTVNENPMVIIDFWAPWCGPCRGFAPVYEKASDSHPDVVFAKVNTDEQQELAGTFGIRSIPTPMGFREKAILFQPAGARPGNPPHKGTAPAPTLPIPQAPPPLSPPKIMNSPP